jgi:hypothetical protein
MMRRKCIESALLEYSVLLYIRKHFFVVAFVQVLFLCIRTNRVRILYLFERILSPILKTGTDQDI